MLGNDDELGNGNGEKVEVEIEDDNEEDRPGDEPEEEERVPKVSLMGHARDGPKKRSADVMVQGKDENMEFCDMQLSEDILKGLRLCRYDKPTPIQFSAIPLGKLSYDLLLQAKSGTGKTCVFTVCILQEVVVTEKRIQALIMTPCREIAVQIAYVMKSIGAFKDGLKVKEFIGGTSVGQSIRRLSNCHVAIGTPGRLAHLVKDYNMDLSHVRVIALDEADKLMEPSFFQDVQVIFNVLPVDKQMITTSATYTEEVLTFLEKFMRSPCRVQLDLTNPALCGVDQYLVDVKKIMGEGGKGTVENEEEFRFKFSCLRQILKRLQFTQAIIFSNWQLRAEKIYDELKDLDIDVVLLSAARSQEDRLEAYTLLQQGKCKMMVATDVAARGIDVEGVDLVINFDVPFDCDTYVHRIGRTGRFGSSGKALSICSFESERKLMSEFQIEVNFTMWVVESLQELTSINDHSQKVQTFRQLKGITDSVTAQDPENHNWKELWKKGMKIKKENDSVENYTWSGFKLNLDVETVLLATEESRELYEIAKKEQEMIRKVTEGTLDNEKGGETAFSSDEEEDYSDSDEDDDDSSEEEDADDGIIDDDSSCIVDEEGFLKIVSDSKV